MDDVIAVVIWWVCGFAGTLWVLDAMNRNLARQYPRATRNYITRGDVLVAALMGVVGIVALVACTICAIGFECGSRNAGMVRWLHQPAFKRRAMLTASKQAQTSEEEL